MYKKQTEIKKTKMKEIGVNWIEKEIERDGGEQTRDKNFF